MNAITQKVEEELLASRGRPLSFVESPAENETQKVLRMALELLGPNGENWAKGRGYDCDTLPEGSYCALTAMNADGRYSPAFCSARDLLERILGEQVYVWNDRPERTFLEVRAMFERAIELAATQE